MLDFDYLEEGMSQGFFDVECPVCGEECRIEPDGEGTCPECGEGKIVSPLMDMGLI